MAYKKAAVFQPVIMFDPTTPEDKLAVDMVYSLQKEVRKTMNTERSAQVTIGISEIGTDCLRCLVRKLSEEYAEAGGGNDGWKAQVGTFIHAGLEEYFVANHSHPDGAVATDQNPLYLPERQLWVLDYKGLKLGGHCDLFVQGASFGLVDDWKTQGPAVLKKTGTGKIPAYYHVQMHTYGLGYELLGFKVTHVVLYALPRDGDLDEARPVLMRYDRQIAIDALQRIRNFLDAHELLEKIYPGEGWERLIRAQPKAASCWDCGRYENHDERTFMANLTD
jgi:hypothetical protein